MPSPKEPLPDTRALTATVMRRQATLSLRVTAVFAVIILGLPLVNQFFPQIANTRVGGFTLSWLVLAVLFYPLTWALSGYFIRASDDIEADISARYRADNVQAKDG